jgi:hypothetical protein
MNKLYLFGALLFFASLFIGSEGTRYLLVDDFAQRGPVINFQVALDEPDAYWWNPYAFQPGRYPEGSFRNTDGALGGQRDVVVGWEGFSNQGTTCTATIQGAAPNPKASAALSLRFVGGVYFQYDGPDYTPQVSANGDRVTGAGVIPGALFNHLPGLGAYTHTDATTKPGRNADGQTYDFTNGGRASAFQITVEADWSVFYYIDVIDSNGFNNSMEFVPTEDVELVYTFAFNDPNWVTNKGSAWDWTDIAGIQVRIWVFSDSENPGEQGSQAVDTTWYQLWTFGYTISGRVEIDCDCNQTGNTPVVGEEISIANSGGTVLATVLTQNDGTFLFAGSYLTPGTYSICIVDASVSRCSNTPQCRPATVSIANPDVINLLFYVIIESTLTPPPDANIQCGECDTVQCLGSATLTDCSGNNIPVTTATDSPRTGCATTTFTRTFTASGQTVTQTITITDNLPPAISTPASDASVECANQTPTFNSWRASRGGAQATDCHPITWTDTYNNEPISCGGVTVTFIATDSCGNTSPTSQTTATYTMNDVTIPTITTPATSPVTPCTSTGSDMNQFNTWLSSNGGAQATDNCGTLGSWSNNYVTGTLTSGCDNSVTVTFTIADLCNNVATTTGTYTIRDTTGPSITTQASGRTLQCTEDVSGQYSAWLSSNGGAVANDACSGTALTWSNNAPAAPSGCTASSTVTFTVADSCGFTSSTTASFSVTDNAPPVINTPASPISIDCSDPTSDTQLQNWVSSNGGASATDACNSITWTNNYTPSTGNCNNVPVTFTVTDACNNVARTTASYTIADNTPPTINVANQAVECVNYTNDQFTTWLNSYTVSDNCAAVDQITVTNDHTGNPPAPGCNVVVTVGWIARDVCGNSSPRTTATFTITDNIPPVFTSTATDQNVPCGSTANSQYTTWLNNRGGAVATDQCGGVTWTHNGPATPAFDGCNGATTVTWTARDSCGLEITTTATFTISDVDGPTLTRPASPLSEECTQAGSSSLTSWLNNHGGATATDSCSAVTWSHDYTGNAGGCSDVTLVTFTAQDACGLTVSTSAEYSFSDTRPPTVTPARDASAPCDANTQNALLAWGQNHGGATATDQCFTPDQLTWSPFTVPPIVGCNFAEVTFVVSDPCGNSASTTATFTSTDSTPPSFNPPAMDFNVECDGAGNNADYQAWLSNHAGAAASDDCSIAFTWTNNGPASAPTTCGAVTVTFTVTDTCNNSARTTAVFRVNDTQAPFFTVPPMDTNNECDGSGNQAALSAWLADEAGAEASDACSTSLTWSHSALPETGDGCNQLFPYTFTVRDACGNTASATANFVLGDSTPPVWECPVEDVEFECDGFGNEGQIEGWLNNHGGGHVVDSCYGEQITWTHNYIEGSVESCSSVVVNFVASDPCGNTVSDSGEVAIIDTRPPTWSFFPDDVTLTCDADVSVEALGAALATDICYGDLFVSMTETEFDEPADGNCPGDHVITRTWTAVDGCGNTVSRDQVITVEIIRSSGPCDNCVCDDCCPPPAPSDCLPVDCHAADCARVPCTAAPCSCGNSKLDVDSDDSIAAYDAKMVESLPQCQPVYIYVNDDDDSEKDVDSTGLERQRMLVTNEPLHESVLKSKSDASSLSYSVFALVFALALFFF